MPSLKVTGIGSALNYCTYTWGVNGRNNWLALPFNNNTGDKIKITKAEFWIAPNVNYSPTFRFVLWDQSSMPTNPTNSNLHGDTETAKFLISGYVDDPTGTLPYPDSKGPGIVFDNLNVEVSTGKFWAGIKADGFNPSQWLMQGRYNGGSDSYYYERFSNETYPTKRSRTIKGILTYEDAQQNVYRWNGSSWSKTATLWRWNGSKWVNTAVAYRWNGKNWEEIK